MGHNSVINVQREAKEGARLERGELGVQSTPGPDDPWGPGVTGYYYPPDIITPLPMGGNNIRG